MRRGLPAPATRCPLTVVGGFLGAGKTTLLNRLLAGSQGRYAVLVNDFGAINVDAGLIRDHDGQTLRLTNGCVCCSLADGFLDTLMRVLAEPEPFDHIVIEASGVGDPGAIAEIALVEPGLVLRGVVVLADAERLPGLAADPRLGDTLARQIRAADLLVLNKRDLVDEAGRAAARDTLAALAPCCRLLRSLGTIAPNGWWATTMRILRGSPSASRCATRSTCRPVTTPSLCRRGWVVLSPITSMSSFSNTGSSSSPKCRR
ncbi:GTP-binding protein [Methylobacterium organophilum]|nr:GTP-binding protein [Methylobacterium organophilum]